MNHVAIARMHSDDKVFAGAIPEVYERFLVPLIFESHAEDLAARVAARTTDRVLEVAAGTGVLTRALAAALPATTTVVATDLNDDMLDQARARSTCRPVEWQTADATALPFDDASFDAVVCQFGIMFMPDKECAFREARRVLGAGGVLAFNVWDRIEENEFADEVTRALAACFPADPPRFLARTPHGYHKRDTIERDLASAGFGARPTFQTVAARSRANSPDIPAIAYCQGTPLRGEIEKRNPDGLAEATQWAAQAIARRFGEDAVEGKIQAHVITVAA